MSSKRSITKRTAEKIARKANAKIKALDASLERVAKTGAASDVSVSAIQGLESVQVQAAIAELLSAILDGDITVDQSTTAQGMLSTTIIKKGGRTIGTINIPRDYVNNIMGLVTIVEGEGADAGKYFDGATEVGPADGVNGAGVYLKTKQDVKAGTPDATYRYADVSRLIEYLTVGNQTGKPVQLTIDPVNHTIVADIPDKGIQKRHLSQALQDVLDAALQRLVVSNIEALTSAQCEALVAGDAVVKASGTKRHAYRVAYKDATTGEMSLVYCDCDSIEEVYYEKSNGVWAFVEKRIGITEEATDLEISGWLSYEEDEVGG